MPKPKIPFQELETANEYYRRYVGELLHRCDMLETELEETKKLIDEPKEQTHEK